MWQPKGKNPLTTTLDEAIEYIKEKRIADAPIATYEELPVPMAPTQIDAAACKCFD